MPINLGAIRSELLPGLRKVTGQYKDLPRLYDKIFELGTSRMAQEAVTSMRYVGLAQLKNDGGNTQFDNLPGERYKYNQLHIGIGIGYAVTRNTIDDNLYAKQFNLSNLGLQKSMNQAKEIFGANVLNNGAILDPNVGGDGQPLFSTAHPVDGNTIANRPFVDMDLTESGLLNAEAQVRQNFRDNANLRMEARVRKLVVPIALQPVGRRLLETDLRPGTNVNDKNILHTNDGGIKEGMLTHDYLTSNFAWFLLTDQEGLSYLQRIPFESDMFPDFLTDNLLVKAFERFSFSFYDFRCGWASFPTS